MSTAKPLSQIRREYARAAKAYEASLPLEHYMEATSQGKQREITLESLDLMAAQRSDFHLFNELLVQYPYGRSQRIRQVVPDNMVVVWDEPIDAEGSFDVPLQPVGPFWVLEYVSKHTQLKDYEDNFRKYERELKVPYYLLFCPEAQDLRLYHHSGKRYVSVPANSADRFPVTELEIEVALLESWVRYWHQGRLLPLPAELQRELNDTRRQLKQSQRELRQAKEQTAQAQEEAERERQEKERLLAQLRQLGIEPK